MATGIASCEQAGYTYNTPDSCSAVHMQLLACMTAGSLSTTSPLVGWLAPALFTCTHLCIYHNKTPNAIYCCGRKQSTRRLPSCCQIFMHSPTRQHAETVTSHNPLAPPPAPKSLQKHRLRRCLGRRCHRSQRMLQMLAYAAAAEAHRHLQHRRAHSPLGSSVPAALPLLRSARRCGKR